MSQIQTTLTSRTPWTSAIYTTLAAVALCVALPAAVQGQTLATMTDPANNGDSLDGDSHTFQWNLSPEATKNNIWVGTSGPGSDEITRSGPIDPPTASHTVTGLPTDGTSTIYVRLWSYINDDWGTNYVDYTYVAGTPPTPSALQISTINTQGQNATFDNVTVTIVDAEGNPINAITNTTVSLSVSSGTGSLSGTLTKTISTGQQTATFDDLSYNVAETGVKITATNTVPGTLTAAESDAFEVEARIPDRLTVATIDNQEAGVPFSVTVETTDSLGRVAPVTSDTLVELILGVGTGSVGGTTTGVIAANTSTCTINGVTYDTAEEDVILTARRVSGFGPLANGSSNAFNVAIGPATTLSIGNLAGIKAGDPFDVTVTAKDDLGNTANVQADTTIQLAVASGTGAIGGTTSGIITAGSNSVTISGVTYNKKEPGVSLTASATAGDVLTAATSNTFTVDAGSPYKLIIGNITAQTAGSGFAVTVTATDQYGNPSNVSSNTDITLSLQFGNGTLGGTTTDTINSGASSVTIAGVTYDTAEPGVIIAANGGSLQADTSNPFTVNPAAASMLAIDVIADQTVNSNFSVVVRSVDAQGNAANTTDNYDITLSVNTGGGGIGGGTTTGVLGTGTSSIQINNVQYDAVEGGVSLTATAAPQGAGPALTAVNSNTFEVVAGAAAGLEIIEPVGAQQAGVGFDVVVRAIDASGNETNVTSAISPTGVLVQLSKDNGTGNFSGTLTGVIPVGSSRVTISGVKYDNAGEVDVRLLADDPVPASLTQDASANFAVTAGPPALISVQAVGNQAAGVGFNVVVDVTDSEGNTANVSQNTGIAVSVVDGTGAVGGTTTGQINAGANTATIGGVTYDTKENNVTLRVSRTSGDVLSAGTSAAFNVSEGPPSTVTVVVPDPVTAATNFNVVVTSVDQYGNPSNVTGDQAVTLSVDTGNGTLSHGVDLVATIADGGNTITKTNLQYDLAETGIILLGDAATLTDATSNTFTCQAGAASNLAIDTVATQGTNVDFDVVVRSQDGGGNAAPVSADTVVRIEKQAGTGAVVGTPEATILAGETSATITGVKWDTAEVGSAQIRAVRQSGDVLANGTSNTFTVEDRTATQLSIDTIADQGASVGFDVVVRILDGSSNPANVADDYDVALSVKTGIGTLGGTFAGTIANGNSVLTISGVEYDTVENGVVLTATATPQGAGPPLTAADSNAFNVTNAPASMTTPPADGKRLTHTDFTFEWDTGAGVTEYRIKVGSTSGGEEYLPLTSTGTTQSQLVTGLPSDGSDVFVTLGSKISGGWQERTYTYKAAADGVPTLLEVQPIGTQGAGDNFTVDVNVTDWAGTPTNVTVNTLVTLSVQSGSGSLTGTITGTINSGSNSVTIGAADLAYNKAETGVVLTATPAVTADDLYADDSDSFEVTAGAPADLVILPIADPQGAGDGFDVTVEVQDTLGNASSVGAPVTVTLSEISGAAGGFIGGAPSGDVQAGSSSITFTDVKWDTVENAIQFRATGGGLTQGDSNTFDVVAGAPDRLAISAIGGQDTDTPFNATVTCQDTLGNATNVLVDTIITLRVNVGSGNLGGTYTGTITAGSNNVAINGITYDTAEAGVVLEAVASGGFPLTAATSGAFAVSAGAPFQLVVSTIANQQANTNFSVTVTAKDAAGNDAVVAAGGADLSLSVAAGTGTLGGTTTGTINAGASSVTINNVQYDTPETGVQLTATQTAGTDTIADGNSNFFTVGAGPPASIIFAAVSGQQAGETFDVTVYSLDSGGYPANVTADRTVTLSVQTGTGSIAGGTSTGTIVSGTDSVTISGVHYDTTETGVVLRATMSGGGPLNGQTADTNAFDVGAGTADRLAISNIANQKAGDPFDVTITATDQYGTGANVSADTTITLTLNTGTGTLGGTLVGTMTAGTNSVTISGVQYDTMENGVVLEATASGGDTLTSATSNTFDFAAGTAAKLVIQTIGDTKKDTDFDVTVDVTDQFGNTANVLWNTTVTLSVHTGTGSLAGTVVGTINTGANTVTIAGVQYDTKEDGVILTATASGSFPLDAADSNAFNVGAGPASKITIDAIPTVALSGPFTVTVRARDAGDNETTVTGDTVIDLSVATGTGALTPATPSGTITAGTSSVDIAVTGYDTAETGVSLTATRTSGDAVGSATSNTFEVDSNIPDRLAITTIGEQRKNSPFSVTVESHNPLDTPAPVATNTLVTLSLKTGTGNLTGTLTGTITAGQSSVTISGINYDTIETGVVLTATATTGDTLNAVDSNAFDVASGAANISSPTDGSTLTGSSVTFTWNAGVGATQYRLWVGTTAGGKDLYNESAGTALSTTVSGLPLDGSAIYVRINSYIAGSWEYRDYTYTAGTATPAAMTTPASDGDNITGPSYTFQWDSGTAVSQYRLWVGTTVGGKDLYNQSTGTTQQATVNTLPLSGTVYVRLNSYIGGSWQHNDYSYSITGSTLAAMTAPASDGDTLTGSSYTFQWNAGTGPTKYNLWVGTGEMTSPTDPDILFKSGSTTSLSATVTGLPTDGSTVYVKLWSLVGSWQSRSYTYTAHSVSGPQSDGGESDAPVQSPTEEPDTPIQAPVQPDNQDGIAFDPTQPTDEEIEALEELYQDTTGEPTPPVPACGFGFSGMLPMMLALLAVGGLSRRRYR